MTKKDKIIYLLRFLAELITRFLTFKKNDR